jgi:signal transduction histidine kinase
VATEACLSDRSELAVEPTVDVSVPLPNTRNIRRNIVNKALHALLDRMRIEAMADLVMVVQASQPQSGTVLASSAVEWICQFLPNEPVQFDIALPSAPRTMVDLNLWSTIRPCLLSCGASMIIPWGSRTTNGWLIMTSSGRPDSVHLTHRVARQYSQQLRRIYIEAGLRNNNKLRLDIARATREIAELDLGIDSLGEQLASVLSVGRGLLRTSSCYLSMPEDDANYFRFVGHVGVRTVDFKRLRMGAGQGLGGRVRDQNRTVRSLNYSRDFRECDAPVQVTVREGFHSAMCTPLISDGRIFALLYAANRHLTPFTESDGEVLAELAGNVSTMLRRAQWDELRESATRRHERDRLARDLHDSVVHNLMEIGYASRLGRDLDDPLSARKHFDAIETAAESCLQAIRGKIAALTSEWDERDSPTAENVVDLLRTSACGKRLVYSFRLGPGTEHKVLPLGVATALVRIGREALRNAELHSAGSRATVELTIENGCVHLVVDDDGRGMNVDMLPTLLASTEHLGLRQMRALAEENRGRCALLSSPAGGLRVEVVVPLG